MFTTFAYSESQDPGGAYVKIAAVPDQTQKVEGDIIYVPNYNRLMGAMMCGGASATGARLTSPTLRRINPYHISPIALALYPDEEPRHSVCREVSIPLDVDEALEMEILSTPGGAERAAGVVWMSDSEITPSAGRIFTARATITLALTAGTWSLSALNFIDELPITDYRVVGAACVCSTSVAFRFVPITYETTIRPGAPNSATEELGRNSIFRAGRVGDWFRFSSIRPPNVEVLGSAAVGSATYNIYLDLIPVGQV